MFNLEKIKTDILLKADYSIQPMAKDLNQLYSKYKYFIFNYRQIFGKAVKTMKNAVII